MAVETTATEATFTGTGASSTYSPGFYANTSGQVQVRVNGILQTIGDDYVLNGLGDSGGVDVVATFTLGALVYILRATPITQLVDTQNNETILEDVIDAEFDKLTMIAQEVNTKAERALALLAGGAGGGFVVTAIASEAISAFDFVNLYVVAGVLYARRANAAVEARYANGFLPFSVDNGASATVVLLGLNPVPTLLDGEVWLGETPGAFTVTPPSAGGSTLQSLGFAVPGVGIFFTPKGRLIL